MKGRGALAVPRCLAWALGTQGQEGGLQLPKAAFCRGIFIKEPHIPWNLIRKSAKVLQPVQPQKQPPLPFHPAPENWRLTRLAAVAGMCSLTSGELRAALSLSSLAALMWECRRVGFWGEDALVSG